MCKCILVFLFGSTTTTDNNKLTLFNYFFHFPSQVWKWISDWRTQKKLPFILSYSPHGSKSPQFLRCHFHIVSKMKAPCIWRRPFRYYDNTDNSRHHIQVQPVIRSTYARIFVCLLARAETSLFHNLKMAFYQIRCAAEVRRKLRLCSIWTTHRGAAGMIWASCWAFILLRFSIVSQVSVVKVDWKERMETRE